MSRRWAPPRPKSPQQQLRLEERGRFTPPVKIQPSTAIESAAGVGIKRSGDAPLAVGELAASMVGVLERHTSRVRLGGVMLAVEVRAKVLAWLQEHPAGATADEIAEAVGHDRLTVRPRVSELYHMRKIKDSGQRRKNVSGRSAVVWVVLT